MVILMLENLAGIYVEWKYSFLINWRKDATLDSYVLNQSLQLQCGYRRQGWAEEELVSGEWRGIIGDETKRKDKDKHMFYI